MKSTEKSPARYTLVGEGHYFKSGLLKEAITEFELALRSSGGEDPQALYRFGVTYRLAGLQGKAREALMRAAAVGDPNMRERAEQELRKMPP